MLRSRANRAINQCKYAESALFFCVVMQSAVVSEIAKEMKGNELCKIDHCTSFCFTKVFLAKIIIVLILSRSLTQRSGLVCIASACVYKGDYPHNYLWIYCQ